VVAEPANAQAESAAQTAAAEVAKSAAAVNATSYRNAEGDTVSISGLVLKDRDGDGGVGLPATKPSASAEKMMSAYSAN
jgi:hypothetical protein